MIITKEVSWLEEYKKEIKDLVDSLDNLTKKQLRGLSLRMKNNVQKVIKEYDYKIPENYFGVAKTILIEEENIKDEYKDEFWKFVYFRFINSQRSNRFDFSLPVDNRSWKNWHVDPKKMKYDSFDKFIYSWDSMKLYYKFDDDYKSEPLFPTFRSYRDRTRILFNLKSKSLTTVCENASIGRLTQSSHLVGALLEEPYNFQLLGAIKPIKFPIDLDINLFKAFCHEWSGAPDSRKYWDDLVLSEEFVSYLKKYAQNNIEGVLATTDKNDLYNQIKEGRIPNLKGLTLSQLNK